MHALQGQQVGLVPGYHASMNDYVRYNPLKFDGKVILDKANDWISNNEKIFAVIDCIKE